MSTICLYVSDMYNVYGSRRILCLYGFGVKWTWSTQSVHWSGMPMDGVDMRSVHVPQPSGEFSSCPI